MDPNRYNLRKDKNINSDIKEEYCDFDENIDYFM